VEAPSFAEIRREIPPGLEAARSCRTGPTRARPPARCRRAEFRPRYGPSFERFLPGPHQDTPLFPTSWWIPTRTRRRRSRRPPGPPRGGPGRRGQAGAVVLEEIHRRLKIPPKATSWWTAGPGQGVFLIDQVDDVAAAGRPRSAGAPPGDPVCPRRGGQVVPHRLDRGAAARRVSMECRALVFLPRGKLFS